MITFIQNDPEVPAAAYGDFLHREGVAFRVVSAFAGEPLPEPTEASHVIVLGGAMGVGDTETHPHLAQLKDWIKRVVATNTPYLGICLGGQLLADACGAKVHANRFAEKGPRVIDVSAPEDPLFHSLPNPFVTFQWHNDSFDVPSNATLLASSTACRNQAFRIGKCAYGLQFHPELTHNVVLIWSDGERGVEAATMVEDFDKIEAEYKGPALQLFKNFLRISR